MPIVRKTVNELSNADEKRLKALAKMKDSEIDTSDMPALSAEYMSAHCLKKSKQLCEK